ncbi:MAG: hypothetical protein E3J64_01020, partial [Anaerolineales bacterium]
MDGILCDINAIDGLVGTFACDSSGAVLGSAMPRDQGAAAAQASAALSVAQIVSGLKHTCMADVGDVDLHCDGGRLIVKSPSERCFGILLCTAPHVNVPESHLTANVATRKLARQIRRLAMEENEPQQWSLEPRPGAVRCGAEYREHPRLGSRSLE